MGVHFSFPTEIKLTQNILLFFFFPIEIIVYIQDRCENGKKYIFQKYSNAFFDCSTEYSEYIHVVSLKIIVYT